MFKSITIPYRHRVLAMLCILTTITYLDRICISLVGIRVKDEFDLNNTQFGWVLAAFSLAYALFEIPSGVLGDRFGPRIVFIRIVLMWSFFTALTGLATGLVSLIFIRFLFGVGESGTYPNIMIVVSRWFPVNETGRALTWVGLGSQIGSAIAPLIIIPIAVFFGWRSSFYVIALIGVVWVWACHKWFKNYPHEVRSIPVKEKHLIESGCRHNRNGHQVIWKTILQSRNVWALMLMYFCCQWGNYFFLAWMPIYLQEGRHFTEDEMKLASTVLFLVGIAGFLVGGVTADFIARVKGIRFGRRFMGVSGLGLCGLFLIMAASTTNHSESSYYLIAANFFYCFGIMVSYAVCTDIGKNNAGTVTGAMNFFGQLGGFLLSISFGTIAEMVNDLNYPLFLVSGVLLAGALLWFAIDPKKQIAEFERTKN
ncbi:MAG TPA: MFS transporter [Flavitalea sp.]|nr:MFS transporter [Flavitalea sp.]